MNNQNIYPDYNEPNNVQLSNQNNQQTIFSKLLPMLLSGKNINDILPTLLPNNPLTNNPILTSFLTTKKSETKKIESDVIDISSLTKIN